MLPEVRLDTDSFKSLIEEYRMQIASIFPEWTNYNYSDPGMTLVELFAWMKENQQFYMEQLSSEHYRSFFRLMGITPRTKVPALVATAVIFNQDIKEETIPKGTVYYADDIPYSTIEDCHIPATKICGIKAGSFITEEELDMNGAVNVYPFGTKAETGETMELYLDRALPVNKECFLAVVLKHAPQRNPVEGFPFELLTRLGFEYYTADGWKEFEKVSDNTKGLLFTGRIGLTVAEAMAKNEDGYYAIRITLEEGVYDRAPFITNIGFHFITLAQYVQADCGRTPEGIVIGEGTGFPYQRIQLPYEGVMNRSVEISVEDILHPGSFKQWHRVDDFSMEGPDSECYMVSETTGEVIFGDGKRGLPPEGKIILHNAVLCRGFAGTAMDGTVMESDNGQSLRVLRTLAVGKDMESVEELKIRIKQGKENIALSTPEDYERQVRSTPGMVINSCKVLESLSTPTKVSIAVRPGDGKELLKLSGHMERNIYNYLNDRRLIGVDIRLLSPEYIKVRTKIQLMPAEHYTDAEKRIKEAVKKYFNEYGSFGDSILYGHLYGIIDGLDCVDRVGSISFDADKVSVIKSRSGDLIPPANGIFICGDIEIDF